MQLYKKFAKTANMYMNDFVKQYSSRIEKHLNLLIRLLLQEQKQSDEDLHSLLMMVYPSTQITILFLILRYFCYLQKFTIMSQSLHKDFFFFRHHYRQFDFFFFFVPFSLNLRQILSQILSIFSPKNYLVRKKVFIY